VNRRSGPLLVRYRPGIVEGFLASIGLHVLPFL